MAARAQHLVVIGTSAGGIETLRELVRTLPADFPAPIAVVLHVSPQSPGMLHDILARAGPLPAVNPRDREPLRGGRIYVAPPDFHLVIEPGRVRITRGPRENRFRPAIDPLFRSAAQVYGPATIGVILSGNLDDGAAGLWAIKQLGGVAIVQDPDDALFPSMPNAALGYVVPDYCVPVRDIARVLVELTAAPVSARTLHVPRAIDIEVSIAKEEGAMAAGIHELGDPSRFACPECHGVLMQVKEGGHVRFRCHTGHAFSVESLLADINESIEESLWNALRSMQEGTMLMRQMARHAEAEHPATDTSKLAARARELERQANAVRQMVGEATPVAQEE